MAEKIITKSFERLLEKGKHRGFITYEELGKSLGKRNCNNQNIERAFIILVDEKITLVEKKSQYQSNKKKRQQIKSKRKHLIKAMIQLECTSGRWAELSFFQERVR